MDGLLIIDKPAGLTSHDVVARVRKIVRERRIGHTGTLDPFATGVLALLIGRATRLAQFLAGADKEYEAVIRLGFATDTGDVDGRPLSTTGEYEKHQITWTREAIQTALRQMCGEVRQIPPMYSAKKRHGQKLYEMARRGEEIEREPVCVTVHAFAPAGTDGPLLKDNQDGTVDLVVRVVCSAGTYVRTLAEDFGKLLGIGAHVAELRRTRAGDFTIDAATTLERLKQVVDEGSIGTLLLPPDAALSGMPFVHLSAAETEQARNGIALSLPASTLLDGEKVRIKDQDGSLVGVGSYDALSQLLRPRVVLPLSSPPKI